MSSGYVQSMRERSSFQERLLLLTFPVSPFQNTHFHSIHCSARNHLQYKTHILGKWGESGRGEGGGNKAKRHLWKKKLATFCKFVFHTFTAQILLQWYYQHLHQVITPQVERKKKMTMLDARSWIVHLIPIPYSLFHFCPKFHTRCI